MRTLLFVSLALALSACGSEVKITPVTPVNQPQYNIPNDALVTDYTCESKKVFIEDNGPVQTLSTTEVGVSRYWTAGEIKYFFDETSDGKIKTYQESTSRNITNTIFQKNITVEDWELINGSWQKKVEKIERIYEKQGDGSSQKVLSNKVNGVDTPYYWDVKTNDLSEKNYVFIYTHNNPSALNKDTKKFLSYTITCTYTDR